MTTKDRHRIVKALDRHIAGYRAAADAKGVPIHASASVRALIARLERARKDQLNRAQEG